MAIDRENRPARDLSHHGAPAMRMPLLERRTGLIGIALALIAGTGGAVLATASSSAEDAVAAGTGELQISAVRDPALAATDPSDADALARLARAAGMPPAPGGAAQTWTVGGHDVLGYTTAGGSFCFAFAGGAGGCLQPGALTPERPLEVMTDYGPGTFNVYGLALDGVTAVTVRLGGTPRPAAFAHNSFAYSDPGLGGTAGVDGELIATMGDGTIHALPIHVGSLAIAPDGLP
jgi:hypothetical protein